MARPDPYHWMHGDTPALTEYLSAERSFYDSSVAHLHPLVSTLKAEMFSRLPPAEVSARWRRTRFSYYTVHLAGNDYAHIVREIHGIETVSKQISPVLGRLADENRTAGRGPARRRVAGGRQRLPRARGDPRQPRRGPARLLRRHHRRRGLRAPLPRPPHRRRPGRGGAAQLLRRRLERRLAVVLLHRPRRGLPAARGVAAPDRDPRDRRRAGAGRAGRAVRPERPGQPVRRRRAAAQREPRHRRGVGVDAHAPESPPRSVGGRRPGVVYRAEHVAGRGRRPPAAGHQRRRRGVPAGPVPGAARRRPGPHRLGRGAPGGPRRAAGAGRRVRGARS